MAPPASRRRRGRGAGRTAAAPRRPAKRDRLSALPDDLLHRILRFLDSRQAVADLSLLSRRWRRVWASSPHIVLPDSDADGFDTFGNWLLLLRDDSFVHHRRWVRHALGRGLRVLEVTVSCNRYFELPDGVFTCATLEEIDFSAGETGVLAPKSVCLPRLKKLHLADVKFTDPSMGEKLSSGCPALEDLSLSQATLGSFKISSETVKTLSITGCNYEGLHVSAPNTCSLELGVVGKVQLVGMPSLVSAWVYLCPDGAKHLARGGYDLVAALRDARQLELLGFGSILQDIMGNSSEECLPFSNLKTLVIGERLVTGFYDPLAYFLQFAPNLASVTLDRRTLYRWKVLMEEKPIGNLELVSGLTRELEMLRIRLSKEDDAKVFRKMQRLLKEKIKNKKMVVKWF
ncbi:hypothetical protein ACP70R_042937 [Stipagrostis hirtigluma subsp. patula]